MSPTSLDVGELVAHLRLDRSDFNRGANESERRFSKLGASLGGAARMAGGVAAAGLAVIGAAAAGGAVALYGTGVQVDALGKKAVTVFGPQLGVAQKWAEKNAAAMGLTKSQAVGLAAGFGDLLIPMGFTREAATKMSTDVIGLSGALSEWSGGQKSAAEVADILSAAMLGETDGLKALGISLSAAEIDAALAAKGQDKLTGAARQQAEALAVQQMILAKSTDAQAAFAAGADDPIRKQSLLKARALELKEAFATALLPASNAVVGGLLALSSDALPKVEAGLGSAMRVVENLTKQVPNLIGAFRDGDLEGAAEVLDNIFGNSGRKIAGFETALTAVRGVLGDLGDVLTGVVLPALQSNADAVGGTESSLYLLISPLALARAALGFVADNTDAFRIALQIALPVYGAYKVATIASSIATSAATVIKALFITTTNAETGAVTLSTLARVHATAGTIAHNVALAALKVGIFLTAGATAAITAAQWLWNAALTANPIGLVIAAIALLVGGLVLAWRESETFRRIVVGALNGVKDFTLEVVGRLVGAWFWFADKILLAAEKAFGWIPGLGDKVKAAREGMAAISGAIQGEINKLQGKDIQLDVKAKGSWTISEARASSELQRYQARAEGGPIFGPGTGTSDSIPAVGPGGAKYRLSDGEHVWTAAEVAALGGHQAMLVMRGAVRRGEIKAYATGGAVGTRANVGAIGATVRGQYDPTENALLGAIAKATAGKAAEAQAQGGMLGGGPGGAMGWQRMMSVLRVVFPGLALNSGFRPGSITATGNRSYHAQGRAVDVPPRMDVFNWIAANYGRGTKELIFSPAGGRQVHNGGPHMYTGVTRANHWDHVHWAMDRGGIARGTGMMPKLTSRPERVLSPQQTEAFERLVDALDRAGPGSDRGVVVTVNADAGLAQTYAEQVAEQTVTKWRDAMAVHGLVP